MRISPVYLKIIPRISILLILVPILLKTMDQAPLIQSIPRLILGGRLDIASIPILLLVSLISCVATLVIPAPSLYTLTIFFASMVTLPGLSPEGNLLASIGLYQVLLVLFVILVMDVMRSHYRGAVAPVIVYEVNRRDLVKGLFLFFALVAAIPGLVSIYIASYIFLFKLHSTSPYLSPVISFLNNNPVGSIIVASILLGVFYALVRQAMEAIIHYAIPSARVALADLSGSIDLRWVKPPLNSIRGFVLSAVITPPVYYMVREILGKVFPSLQEGQADLLPRIAVFIIGVAMFIAIWSILSRSVFNEEREPTPGDMATLVLVIAGIYAISYLAGMPPGFPASSGLDEMLGPIVAYYRDAWVVAELMARAMGVAP